MIFKNALLGFRINELKNALGLRDKEENCTV
jgi:hypothetical protein